LSSEKEIEVPEIGPTVIDTVRLVYDNWQSASGRDYKYKNPDGEESEDKKTDESGYIEEKKFTAGDNKVNLVSEEEIEQTVDGDNPGPLPVLDLRVKKEGGKGPLRSGDSRKDLVKQVQKMLAALRYDLGDTGPDKDGVDGSFRSKTVDAIKSFQAAHKDWEGKALSSDGRVGPRTGDALNRIMVGRWYAKYDTPSELSKDLKLITVMEKIAVEEGVEF